jgi:hypothetical protein
MHHLYQKKNFNSSTKPSGQLMEAMTSNIPQLMRGGSMLGIGQKLNLNVPYFESNYSCLFVDFLLLNIKITLNMKRYNLFVSNFINFGKGQNKQL